MSIRGLDFIKYQKPDTIFTPKQIMDDVENAATSTSLPPNLNKKALGVVRDNAINSINAIMADNSWIETTSLTYNVTGSEKVLIDALADFYRRKELLMRKSGVI